MSKKALKSPKSPKWNLLFSWWIAYVNQFPFCGNHAEWRRFGPLLFVVFFSSGLSVCSMVRVQSRDMFVAWSWAHERICDCLCKSIPILWEPCWMAQILFFFVVCYFFPCGLSFFSHTLEWPIWEMELSMMSMDILKVCRSHHDVLIMLPIHLPL